MPALALARELQSRDDWEVSWLGTQGMESSLVAKEGMHFFPLDIAALRGKSWWRILGYPFILTRALIQSLALLLRLKPVGVLVTGGYVGFPTAVAAKMLGKPLFIQEQNIHWGMATRCIERLARKMYLGFPHEGARRKTMIYYGNPTPMEAQRAAIGKQSPQERYAKRKGPLRIFVTGGSQGALVFNQIVPQALAQLPAKNFTVYHQCGAGWLRETRQYYARSNSRVRVEEFVTDMTEPYLWADLVIARAGALTLAELSLVGVASWLVPFPFAADNHQELNARFFTVRAAAVLIHQRDFMVPNLIKKLSSLSSGVQGDARKLLANTAVKAHLLATPYASRRIIDDIVEELKCA